MMDHYLGDGLYATVTSGMVELYASNGVTKTDRVYLEPGVLEEFLRWVAENKLAV
jgi:hypothetical protein